MNDPNPLPPIPANFGLRYIAWWIWCHMIFLLSIVQGGLSAAMLVADSPKDPANPAAGTLFPHIWVVGFMLGNAILTAILSRVERKMPTA
jgi:hypothetical protein